MDQGRRGVSAGGDVSGVREREGGPNWIQDALSF